MDALRRGFALGSSARIEVSALLCTAALGVVGFVVLYPLILLILNSFQVAGPDQGSSYGLGNWVTALSQPGVITAVTNTISLTLILQLISFPVAVFIAWLLARTDMPGRNWIDFLFWISFFSPSLPIILGWILLLDPDFGLINLGLQRFFSLEASLFDIYSFWGIVWVHLVTRTIAVKVILFTPLIRNMDSSLEEASQVAGVGVLGTLYRITVPIMAPTFMVVMILSIIHLLESFEIEQVLGPPFQFYVYSTMIYRLLQAEPAQYGAATVLAVVILLAVTPLILLQNRIGKKRRYATLTGQYKAQRLSLRAWRWPAFVMVFGMGVFFTLLPVIFLLLATLMPLFGFFNLPDPWTFRHWERVLSDPIFLHSLRNTLFLGVGTAFLAISFYPLIAYITVRTSYRARQVLDFLSWLPVAIPGIILGLGLLWLFLDTPIFRPLYGSIFVLILATTLISMTLGVQLVKSNLLQLGRDLEEASWVAGGSWLYTFRRVILPIQLPILVTVGTVAFISATRNIAGIALLVTGQNRPLAMLQLDYMMDGSYEAAAVVGVIVMLLTTGVALIARFFGFKVGIRM